jgi:AcrR family transcriptional regulator
VAASRSFTLPEGDRRQTRDATEQRILEATNSLLDGGASLAGLSVNRIAEQAGVSRATFYLHFSDKRGLIARLAETELAEFARVTDPFLDAPDAGREELGHVVASLIQTWRDHAGVLSSLIELAEYDADSREAWQAIVGEVAARIAVALRARRPELSRQQSMTLAEVIAWSGERTCHQMISRDGSERRASEVAAALTDLVWRAIEPR